MKNLVQTIKNNSNNNNWNFPKKPVKLVLYRDHTQGARVKLTCPKHSPSPGKVQDSHPSSSSMSEREDVDISEAIYAKRKKQ